MKWFLCRRAAMLAMFLWFSLAFGMTAAAKPSSSVSLSIMAAVEITGEVPTSPDTFQIKLVPSDGTAPMPEGGQDILELRGAGQGTFPAITYDKPGVYRYSLSQLQGTASCRYDTSEYNLTVTVVNSGNEMELAAILYQDNVNNKLEMPVFRNRYRTEPDSSESSGSDGDDGPDSPSEPSSPERPLDEKPDTPHTHSWPELVPTGVEDKWPFYAAGIIVLLLIAARMAWILFKKEESDGSQES